MLRIRKGLTEVDWTSTRLDQFAQYFSNQLARYQKILATVHEQAEPLICDKIRQIRQTQMFSDLEFGDEPQ